MTELEIKIRKRMDEAAKEDRERFFRVADSLHFQPKYADRLAELEALKQAWRDITSLPDYPNIDWAPALPEWFPVVHFASRWEKDTYIAQQLEEAQYAES